MHSVREELLEAVAHGDVESVGYGVFQLSFGAVSEAGMLHEVRCKLHRVIHGAGGFGAALTQVVWWQVQRVVCSMEG